MSRAPLAVFISFSGDGGPEHMTINLIDEFARRGLAVDLLPVRAESAHLRALPAEVRVVDLQLRHTGLAAPALARYLRRERPRAMLAIKDRAIRAAGLARQRAGVPTRLVGRIGTTLSAAIANKNRLARWWRLRPLARGYARVDHIVAVSAGVASDVIRTARLPADQVSVIANPVITPDLHRRAQAAAPHPWLSDGGPPVILGAGRLTLQKDFTTLLRAFATLRQQYDRPTRLIVLGEGGQRSHLVQLASDLGIADQVALPGFSDNPYAYMARASLFVLSSAWEGSPNVLTEALALGLPAVATDCPSGPREVLQNGRIGALAKVGDHAGLAAAMATALQHPPEPQLLTAAVADYNAERSAERYLETLQIRT